MKRYAITIAVVSAIVVVLASTVHAQPKGEGFLGLWQGVGSDGALVITDISDVDGDGELRYQVYVSFSPACTETGELGRILATPLAPPTIIEEGDLIVNVKVTCLLTERVIEEKTEITLKIIDDNTILNVKREQPFRRVSIR